MNPTIQTFLRARQTPDTSLKSLTAARAATDAAGLPRLQRSTRFAEAEITWRGRQWLLSMPLSPAALEVLAIIAYNQPVSRSFIEQVRGVDSSSSVSGLLEKGLIEEAGRLDLPGRPVAFRTTDVFLRCFGLPSLEDLPPVRGTESGAAQ